MFKPTKAPSFGDADTFGDFVDMDEEHAVIAPQDED